MKILLLTKPDFDYAYQLFSWLNDEGHICDMWLNRPHTKSFENYDLVISYYYPHILRKENLGAPKFGCINIHPSYLPFNRGAHPNVWAIVDETLAGVTIHWMDDGVDTGNILYQEAVPVFQHDTGESLYKRLLDTSLSLAMEFLPEILYSLSSGQIPEGEKQKNDLATCHLVRELNDLRNIDTFLYDDSVWKFFNILRACTFMEYPGAYFIGGDGRKIYLSLALTPEDKYEKG